MISKLDRFKVLEEVGRGGTGAVYRAMDPVIDRAVAIKVFRMDGSRDSDEQWIRERLFREARSAGQMTHPGIVTIYQAGEVDDIAYIAMEFVDGQTLRTLMASSGSTGAEQLCQILVEVGAALDYAHGRGLVHRDIKPENIMVTTSGAAKVTDFGIAKPMVGRTDTIAGELVGTPRYMSPEQVRGQPLDGRSDQFSLAIIAYEMLTGRAPFAADQITAVCYQITHEDPPSPEAAGLSTEIATILRRGLGKEPADRFPSCTAFATALASACNRSTQITAIPPVRRSHLLRRTAVCAAGGFALAAVLLSAAALSPTPYPKRAALVPVVRDDAATVAREGQLMWTGTARQGDLVRISRSRPSTGSLTGELPAGPVSVKLYAAESTPTGVTVFTADPQETGFLYDPRRSTDVTLFERPGPENHWERLTVVANTNISAFSIAWRVQ